ncbi:MAG TPA: alpha/beta fold hydrolase [Ktedonobacterales bacterium]|nr:alpha/beta fold hydrolase [Ktedonobacterales bacterium]
MSDTPRSGEPAQIAVLAYGPLPQQFGELRLPAGPGPHPALVMVHGGFWRARYGLDYFGDICEALAAAGVATWNIEYRRLGDPGGGWPGTLLDVAAAVDHTRTLAARYPLDLARTGALGHSAGGHLALWAAGRARIHAASPLRAEDPLRLRCAVALAGVSDLRRAWELRLSNNVTEEFLGGTPTEVPERYAAASPAELLPLGVTQLLLHGTEDDSVPYDMSMRYLAAAGAAGDGATLMTLAGKGHFEMVDPATAAWRTVLALTLRRLGVGAGA